MEIFLANVDFAHKQNVGSFGKLLRVAPQSVHQLMPQYASEIVKPLVESPTRHDQLFHQIICVWFAAIIRPSVDLERGQWRTPVKWLDDVSTGVQEGKCCGIVTFVNQRNDLACTR